MLIACSYVVERRQVSCYSFSRVYSAHWVVTQEQYYQQHSITIPKSEKTALFWGISVDEMEKSILKTVAYLISHIFDFYGIEVH